MRLSVLLFCFTLGCSGASEGQTGDGDGDGDAPASGGTSSGGEANEETGGAAGGATSGGAHSGGASSGGETAAGGENSTSSGGIFEGSSGGADIGTGGDTTQSGGAPSESIPLSEMQFIATLKEGDCWKDPTTSGDCSPIPEFSPPVLEWRCDGTQAVLLVPPGSCMRLSGWFSREEECLPPTDSCLEQGVAYTSQRLTNNQDEPLVAYVNRRSDCEDYWQADWFEECP